MNIIKKKSGKRKEVLFSAGDVLTVQNSLEGEIDVFVVRHPYDPDTFFLVSTDGKKTWFSQSDGKTVEKINQHFKILAHYPSEDIVMEVTEC